MTGSSILRIHSRPPGEPSRTSADPIPSCPSSRAPPARRVGRGGQRSDVALVDEAVGVARRVPALKAGLVYPAPAEVVAVREEARIDSHTADVGVRVDARHPRADALRIEDVVPGGIERVGRIDASAVPADLHHLRPPLNRRSCAAGCAAPRTIPPRCTEPVSFGLRGSLTSYCLSSPVPQQDTYSQRSSTDRSMSVTSGGTAPKGCSAGGSSDASAGSAGIVIAFFAVHSSPPRRHSHTEAERASTLITTPTKPHVFRGSWAGRSSSTIWCSSPRSIRWTSLPSERLQKLRWWPKRRPSKSSGFRPLSIIDGVPHSEVIATSSRRCHHTS